MAGYMGSPDVVEELINHATDLDVNGTNAVSAFLLFPVLSASLSLQLHVATGSVILTYPHVKLLSPICIEFILATACMQDGLSPLMIATNEKKLKVVKALLKSETIDINLQHEVSIIINSIFFVSNF